MINVNLGCGGYPIAGWLNYDLVRCKGVISHDLRQKLPLANQSVDLVFSEHFLEHLDFVEGMNLLTECHRILKPGGRMRLVTPDLHKIASMYLRGHLTEMDALGLGASNEWNYCRFFNQACHAWGHKFLWDEPYLAQKLNQLGFRKIHVSTFPSDTFPGNRNITTDLIMECEK